jgi:phage regulator Rha-like protein
MNELVRLTTQDVGKAIPITDSFVIAEKTKREHRVILKLIRQYYDDIKEFGQVTPEVRLIEFETRTQEIEVFDLNEGQATFLITLMRNTPEVLRFKKDLVKAFLNMKKELIARIETRHIGISARKNLTDTIKKCVDDNTNFKKWAYSTYSKLVYKKIIGKDVKKIKEERNIKENENVRDYFTIEELEKIQDLESKIANFIEFTNTEGKDDKEIYAMVKKYLDESIDK